MSMNGTLVEYDSESSVDISDFSMFEGCKPSTPQMSGGGPDHKINTEHDELHLDRKKQKNANHTWW